MKVLDRYISLIESYKSISLSSFSVKVVDDKVFLPASDEFYVCQTDNSRYKKLEICSTKVKSPLFEIDKACEIHDRYGFCSHTKFIPYCFYLNRINRNVYLCIFNTYSCMSDARLEIILYKLCSTGVKYPHWLQNVRSGEFDKYINQFKANSGVLNINGNLLYKI